MGVRKLIARAPLSWSGIALGAIALLVAAVHSAAGPFDREPPIDEVVLEEAKSIYETLRRQFAEDEAPPGPRPGIAEEAQSSIDRRLHAVTAGCGALAVALAFAGFVRREDPRACGSAAVLGVAALPLPLSLGVLIAALIVSIAWRLQPRPQHRNSPPEDRDQARL